MNLTDGNVFWQKKNKIKNTYPYITADCSCDVLIVGGGIAGAITAYYLAKEGVNVIIAEKNIIGYGRTAAATAILEYSLDIDLNKLEKMLGLNNAKRAYDLCLDAITDIENIDKEIGKKSDFRRKDSLYFSNKLMQRGSIIKEYEFRKKLGFDVKFIDQNSSINLNSAIITSCGAADIDPYKFTTELLEYLSKFENVRIFENTDIENIKCNYDNVVCATNNKFKIKADKLIFTNGVAALRYIQTNIVSLYKTFTIVTKPCVELNKLDTSFVAKDMCEPYHYIRFTKDGRIIFGGEDVKLCGKMEDETYLKNLSKDKYSKLNVCLNRMFYNLSEPEIEYAYSGTFVNTVDTLPIVDEIENMPNCFCNLGFGANGILYSSIGGKMLKDAVKGLYTKDMKMFRLKRE
ncbi:MAG: FAD-dependent oxidoreductase [Clostridia bacterium]